MIGARARSGQVLIELPVAMWVLFVVFGIPLIGLSSLSYRASLLYFGVRDTCGKASRAPSFTQAISVASTTWTKDLKPWNISATEQLYVIAYPTPTGAANGATEQVFTTPAAISAFMSGQNYNSKYYLYLMRLNAQASIDPLLPTGWTWIGLTIPGLNAAYPLIATYESYIENPTGMKN